MWRLKIVVVALIVAGLAWWAWRVHEANKGFTPWMSHAELEKLVAPIDSPAPGSKPQWLDAVEGRWRDGAAQFRVRFSDTPQDCYCQWYWCADRDANTFTRHEKALGDQGYAMLDANTFTEADGSRHYQAVWHLMVPKMRAPGSPQPPPSTAMLAPEALKPVALHGPSPIGVTLVPCAASFASFANFDEKIRVEPAPKNKPQVVSAELEIRFPKENRRVIRFPYIWDLGAGDSVDDERALKVPGQTIGRLSDAQLRRMGAVKPGLYEIAMYINGGRASNVATVRIDPKAKTPPVLQLVEAEANPMEKLGHVELLARGPTPADPKLVYGPDLVYAPIKVDGTMRKRSQDPWNQPGGPVPSGTTYSISLELGKYQPAINAAKSHKIDFKFGKYSARTLRFDPSKNDGKTWDTATPKLKMPARVPVQMEGRVTTADGKPMPLCEVDLASMDGTIFTETTDADGHYEFGGLQQGTYQVSFNDYLNRGVTLANTMATIPSSGTRRIDFQGK